MHLRYWLLALIVAACGKDNGTSATKPSGSGDPPAGTASGAPAKPPAPAGSVEVFVDDQSVATVTTEQIAKWPRLDTLVPEDARRLGTWKTVSLRGAADKQIQHPSATYPEMVGALFPGEGGPAFGMFDPVELAKHGKPGLLQDKLREIRIVRSKGDRGGEHQGGTGGGEDPLKLVVAIKTAGGDKQLTGEQILAIPREDMPGNTETKGWPLTKLLAAAGITKFGKLVLIDAAGTSISLEHKDFDDKTVIPFIKLNRQGSLRFRLLKKQGEGWQFAGDLRALQTIKVD